MALCQEPAPSLMAWIALMRVKAVVEKLRSMGRVVSEKRPYIHAVGHCSRCDTTVEPRLSKQWFVKVAPLAKAAGDAVRDGKVKD